jgi:TetR/AcrR family transcriptional regulator
MLTSAWSSGGPRLEVDFVDGATFEPPCHRKLISALLTPEERDRGALRTLSVARAPRMVHELVGRLRAGAPRGRASEVRAASAMPSDDLKAFRIRQAPGRGRKPAPGADIEAKILDAAEFVFGHFGFRGATTALIAKKAAIAKPHIYYYFEDKEDLYRAILERAMNMWARELETLDTASDIQTILTRYIHRKVDFSRHHPDLSRLYANEIISGATFIGSFIEKVSTPLLLEKVATVEAWVASGAARSISAVDLFFCIWAMTQAYADFAGQMTIMKRKRVLDEVDYDTAKATIVQLVLGGLGLAGSERSAKKASRKRVRK